MISYSEVKSTDDEKRKVTVDGKTYKLAKAGDKVMVIKQVADRFRQKYKNDKGLEITDDLATLPDGHKGSINVADVECTEEVMAVFGKKIVFPKGKSQQLVAYTTLMQRRFPTKVNILDKAITTDGNLISELTGPEQKKEKPVEEATEEQTLYNIDALFNKGRSLGASKDLKVEFCEQAGLEPNDTMTWENFKEAFVTFKKHRDETGPDIERIQE